jgi:hypothetical protein
MSDAHPDSKPGAERKAAPPAAKCHIVSLLKTFCGGCWSCLTSPCRQIRKSWVDLTAKYPEKPIEFITMVVTVIGLVVAIATVGFVAWQLHELNETLESQAYNYIDDNQLELDKAFVEKPQYRKYFYENALLPADSNEVDEILALVDLKLDIIDAFYSQADHIDWKKHYTRAAWDEFYSDSFRCSQILCQRICKDWNEYGTDIRAIATGESACGQSLKLTPIPGRQDGKKSCEWQNVETKCERLKPALAPASRG